jgi:hypothetical protein
MALPDLGCYDAEADGAVGQQREEKKDQCIVELVGEEPTDRHVGLLLVASLACTWRYCTAAGWIGL